jgi:hypothetical protein
MTESFKRNYALFWLRADEEADSSGCGLCIVCVHTGNRRRAFFPLLRILRCNSDLLLSGTYKSGVHTFRFSLLSFSIPSFGAQCLIQGLILDNPVVFLCPERHIPDLLSLSKH